MADGKATGNSDEENLPEMKKRRLFYSYIGLHNIYYGAFGENAAKARRIDSLSGRQAGRLLYVALWLEL